MRTRAAIFFLAAALLPAQPTRRITSPQEALGFRVGDDYQIANYTKMEAYWKTLAAESDRVKLTDIGLTAEGRHEWMAVVTSPANHRNLARYREIAQRLAHAESLTEEQAHA